MSKRPANTKRFCGKCELELDDLGHCKKHWPIERDRLADYRRLTVVGKVATRTSVAEDLLVVLDSHVGPTVERLLDTLATLTEATSAAQPTTLESTRGRPQDAPIPRFTPAWADMVQRQADDRLWEMAEELTSFLNRPTDPKTWSACDTCGNKRLGDSSYCRDCGARILAGARRCRKVGCPNEGRRRSRCPKDVAH